MDSNRREGAYVFWAGLGLAILTSLPFALGAVLSSPNLHFSGFAVGIEDGNTYLAKMLQGYRGAWVYRLAFTPEPQAGGFLYVLYLTLGKLARLTGLPLIWVFHLSRVAATPVALYAFYRLAGYFSPHPAVRRLATALFAVGSGLGWLWVLLHQSTALGQMPVDLWVPDTSFFLSVLTYPHLIVGQALLFAYVLWTLRFLDHGRWPDGLAAGAAGLGMSLIQPYKLPVIAVPLALFVLWQGHREWRTLWRPALRLSVTCLPSVPYLVYSLILFTANPVYAQWRAQNLTRSPAPHLYVLGFGVPLVFAGLALLRRKADVLPDRAFLCIWALAVPILSYAPIDQQRRFLDGYQAPIAILAATGLYFAGQHIRQPRPRVALAASVLAVTSLTPVLLLFGSIAGVVGKAEPVFRPGWEISAARWFASDSTSPVVLSTYTTGNLLPAYAPVYAFVGHGMETVGLAEKIGLVARFFDPSTPDTWRQELLARFAVGYVYYGPRERQLGQIDLDMLPFLRRVYDEGAVQIYRVEQDYLLQKGEHH